MHFGMFFHSDSIRRSAGAETVQRPAEYAHTGRTESSQSVLLSTYNFSQQSR